MPRSAIVPNIFSGRRPMRIGAHCKPWPRSNAMLMLLLPQCKPYKLKSQPSNPNAMPQLLPLLLPSKLDAMPQLLLLLLPSKLDAQPLKLPQLMKHAGVQRVCHRT
jgi:hypothetical protein